MKKWFFEACESFVTGMLLGLLLFYLFAAFRPMVMAYYNMWFMR